jgi:hypothetical protein
VSPETVAPGPAPDEAVAGGDRPEAIRRPWPRRLLALLALAVLAVVAGLWFRGFSFHTWMGDDLYAWAYYEAKPSFDDLFLTASGGKYRPFATALHWVLFQAFPDDFAAWTYSNAGLELLTAFLVFWLVLRVARRDLLIAFAAGLLFITSRFSYYNVFQVMGTMEALGMLLLVLVLHVSVTYVRRDARWPGFALIGLFLAISLTHERYLALFPFLVLLVILKGRSSWRARALELALLCLPPVLNVVLKRYVFATSVMMGTGGQELGVDPIGILRYLTKGGANLVWVNWGPDYLSGITMSETGGLARLVVAVIVLTIVACAVASVLRIVRSTDTSERRDEVKYFVLWLVLTGSLLLVASITIRQEYRWLYAPWAVCLVYFFYQYARLPWRRSVSVAVLVFLCVCIVGMDSYYRRYQGNVFFFYGERIADSGRLATVGRYGDEMAGKTVYLEKSTEVDWIVGHDLLLSPYLGADYRRIVWVDSFDSLDPKTVQRDRSVLLRLDWPARQLVDVTDEVLAP